MVGAPIGIDIIAGRADCWGGTGGRHLGLGGRFLGRCRAGLAAAQAKKAVGGMGPDSGGVERAGKGRAGGGSGSGEG